MNNVPTWQQILGTTQVSQLNIQSPYNSSMDVANQFPAGAFAGSQINNLSVVSVGSNDSQSAVLSGVDPLWRIFVGAQNPAVAPFRVDLNGNVYADSLTTPGAIPAGGAAADINTHSGTVNANKINAVTLSAIQALLGNVSVGGSGNGNGIIDIYDAANALKVILDNSGLTINGGKIVINDTNNSLVLDATGVKSTTQFINGSIIQGSSQNTTSTSFVDISGTSISFTLPRVANVLIVYSTIGLNTGINGGNYNCLTGLNVDGSITGGILYTPGVPINGGVGVQSTSAGASTVMQLGAGSHTLKLQLRALNGGTAAVGYAAISYAVLGT